MRSLQQLVRAAQRAMRREQQERAAAARLQHRQRGLDHRLGVRRDRSDRPAVPCGAYSSAWRSKSNGTRPGARRGLLEAELALEMREVLAHRERRRGEDPGARMVRHLLAEQLRRHQRRDVQLQRLAEHLDPAHLVRGVPRLAAMRASSAAASAARRAQAPRPFGALGLLARAARAAPPAPAPSACSASANPGLAQRLRPAEPQPFLREAQPQVARRLVEPRCDAVQLGRRAARGAQLQARVARELDQLRASTPSRRRRARAVSGSWCASSKITVLHDGQQLGDALVAQRHVGEEQVVVHHHHVGRERVLARAHHEAVLVLRAVLAEAVLARRGGVRPDRRVLRDVGELGAVAGDRGRGEVRDAAQPRRVLARFEAALGCARARGGTGRRSWRGP